MDEKIEKAIELLVVQAARTGANIKPEEAMKLTQAALNLAHVKQILSGRGKTKPNET